MIKKKRKFKRFPDYDCDGGCPYESPESCTVCLNRKNKVIMSEALINLICDLLWIISISIAIILINSFSGIEYESRRSK